MRTVLNPSVPLFREARYLLAEGEVRDPAARTVYELDVIVRGDFGQATLAIGEAKWGKQLGLDDLRRLERARELLRKRPGPSAEHAKLLLASGTGFAPQLRSAARQRDDVVLVDGKVLYGATGGGRRG